MTKANARTRLSQELHEEILHLVGFRWRPAQIAQHLHVSKSCVEKHLREAGLEVPEDDQ